MRGLQIVSAGAEDARIFFCLLNFSYTAARKLKAAARYYRAFFALINRFLFRMLARIIGKEDKKGKGRHTFPLSFGGQSVLYASEAAAIQNMRRVPARNFLFFSRGRSRSTFLSSLL